MSDRIEKDFLGEKRFGPRCDFNEINLPQTQPGGSIMPGKSLHHIVVKERKILTQQKWDEVFSFENLVRPKFEQ